MRSLNTYFDRLDDRDGDSDSKRSKADREDDCYNLD